MGSALSSSEGHLAIYCFSSRGARVTFLMYRAGGQLCLETFLGSPVCTSHSPRSPGRHLPVQSALHTCSPVCPAAPGVSGSLSRTPRTQVAPGSGRAAPPPRGAAGGRVRARAPPGWGPDSTERPLEHFRQIVSSYRARCSRLPMALRLWGEAWRPEQRRLTSSQALGKRQLLLPLAHGCLGQMERVQLVDTIC